jgi:hypothetical protein
MFNTLFTNYTMFWYSLSRCMCVTWSWRTCILAFGFVLKSGCDIESRRKWEVDDFFENHRKVIGYSINDLNGSPAFCTHRIPMEDQCKLVVDHQRRLTHAMREVVKKEVIKLLDAGIILWRPNFLINVINDNDRIGWVKPTGHRSNLGQPGSSPRKPRQWTLLDPLTKFTDTRDQPLVKDTVKPRLNIDVSECRPELLPRSPKLT